MAIKEVWYDDYDRYKEKVSYLFSKKLIVNYEISYDPILCLVKTWVLSSSDKVYTHLFTERGELIRRRVY